MNDMEFARRNHDVAICDCEWCKCLRVNYPVNWFTPRVAKLEEIRK